MKKQIIFTTIAFLTGNMALAKVSSRWRPLVDANIQCTVVKAESFYNGKERYIFNAQNPKLETLVQDGGQKYDDAKCFLADAKSAQESASIGTCFPINDTTVKEFSTNRLHLISRDGLKTDLKIDFATGKGSYTMSYRGCDWGRKCVNISESFQVINCTLN